MSRVLALLVLTVTTVALWLMYALLADFSLFGSSMLPRALNALAWIASALLAVYVLAQLILQVILAELLEIEPSGLHRGLVVAVLTFGATAVVLAHFQFDVSALLTTSAVLSLFVGFATRATLGSLIAGSTLGMDRLIRVGDGLIQGGQPVEIVALNWRSVTARRADGGTVLIPNAAIADSTVEVLPGDRPVRMETSITVPAAIPPQRVGAIVDDVLGDLPHIDYGKPIVIAPATFETDRGFLRYVVRYWVRHFARRAATENEILRRLWYAFQREAIPSFGANFDEELRRANDGALHQAIEAALQRRVTPSQRAVLTAMSDQPKTGQLLLYAPGERIVLPARFDGGIFLLVDGELCDAASESQPGQQPERALGFARRVALQRIIERLAERIGPYAEYAVMRCADRTVSLNEICETVAAEIDDEPARAAFLSETRQEEEETYKPGALFGAVQDAAKNVVSKPPTRAVGATTILAVTADQLGKTAAAVEQPAAVG